MAKPIKLLAALFSLWISAFVFSASVDSDDVAAIRELRGLSPHDKRSITAPLVEFSPFTADNKTVVPGFADPLGSGIDPGLKVFSGKVQFMDLLGFFRVQPSDAVAEVELPPGALKGIDLLDDFLAVYLSYNGRAYDGSILNITDDPVVERDGLPVTPRNESTVTGRIRRSVRKPETGHPALDPLSGKGKTHTCHGRGDQAAAVALCKTLCLSVRRNLEARRLP